MPIWWMLTIASVVLGATAGAQVGYGTSLGIGDDMAAGMRSTFMMADLMRIGSLLSLVAAVHTLSRWQTEKYQLLTGAEELG